jgi:N-acetylmuramoyl-L-alanine amidase
LPRPAPVVRAASGVAVLLIVANCTATGPVTEMSRHASPTSVAPEAVESAVRSAGPADVACLAEAIYFEARGTGKAGESAVAHVVVNRVRSPSFPRSVCGVVADGCQFSYRCDGRPDALTEASARDRAFRIAEEVIEGAPDITRGALFFHSARMEPGWFSTRPRVGTFGGNIFYR